MKWNIVTDSSCDLFPMEEQSGKVQVSSVPFVIRVGEQDFVDDEHLDTARMLDAMEQCKQASHTACPAPQRWLEQFEKAERCIAITISSRLSGSMGSALAARELEMECAPNKKIAVLDSCSTGPEITMCIEAILEFIQQGVEFEEIVTRANAFLRNTHIAFALSSFDNLVKNGRMSKAAGFLASRLGIWGIGVGSDQGTIAMKGKTRGKANAIAMLLEDMKEHGFSGGKVIISHCQNPAFAEKLREKIGEAWKDARVSIMPTRGLCSYYAERGGVILSY